MNTLVIRSASCFLVGLLATSAACALGVGDDVATSPELSAGQVVASMLAHNTEREKSLQGYESLRRYRLEYKGFPSSKAAEIEVAVKFTAPGRKDFQIISEQGSSLLVNKVLKRLLEAEQEASSQSAKFQSELSPANYRFELAGVDKVDGRVQYVLLVEPLRKDKLLYQGKIWVDAEDFAVSLIEAEPARNPSFWTTKTRIVHQYTKVGEFWLPAHNDSDSATRFGGHARLTILYTGYVLNGQRAMNSESVVPATPQP
jgi:hypothetical protein